MKPKNTKKKEWLFQLQFHRVDTSVEGDGRIFLAQFDALQFEDFGGLSKHVEGLQKKFQNDMPEGYGYMLCEQTSPMFFKVKK